MHVAVLGASGLVGRQMLAILEARDFPVTELRLLASERSAGDTLDFRGRPIMVQATTEESFEGIDIVLASAGGGPSKAWLPVAVRAGAVCIDNSSAWRMDPTVPLVVPEINAEAIRAHKGIIANPNCSTIQMVMALEPLHRLAGLERVVVATYQSVSGKGKAAVVELEQQTARILNGQDFESSAFPWQIAFNCLPHIDEPSDGGFTREEWKMIKETRKIMGLEALPVVSTCVRVPVFYGHSEAVFAEFARPITVEAAREALAAFPGVRVVDDLADAIYPMPAVIGESLDEVLVGRIRQDPSTKHGLAFWVVADNVRKGAALNAVQIAEWMADQGLVGARVH